MSYQRMALGKKGERAAVNYLKQRGYKILETNFRCKIGELDIIAKTRNSLVFVEVRSRSSKRFGLPQESIGRNKQEKIRKVALFYLQSAVKELPMVRFDVVALYFSANGEVQNIEHFENAF